MTKKGDPVGIRMEHGHSPFHPLEQSVGNMDLKLSWYLIDTQKTDKDRVNKYLELKERVQGWLPKRDFSNGFTADDFELLNSGKEKAVDEYPAFGALFHLCAAERMLALGHREVAWACIYRAKSALVDAEINSVIAKNTLTKKQIGGMKKGASGDECLAYAALLIREAARIRKAPWTSRKEAIDEIHPLMEAFVGAYRKTNKKPTLRKDLGKWITTTPEVMAAFSETCTPAALAAEE